MNEAFADIEELFHEASSLDPHERTRYLAQVREHDRELADELAELLAADEPGIGRVPENPPPTQAQAAALNAMQGQGELAELDPASREVLDRLSSRTNAQGRYSVRGEVGRGGMGAVLEVWDEDLKRRLAMKVTLEESAMANPVGLSSITLARFLEEAQVTGQLDHPGIVPVHELGVDDKGRVYFTMRLVRGRPLDEIFELARECQEGWNLVRALGVLLKVCEAMAYAHSKGVIHRDLKPANVMVGRFGEVYVMDWGVAHVMGTEAEPPAREGSSTFTVSSVWTTRAKGREETREDPLNTSQGTVLGTPYYMPPEQAGGQYDRVDERADVYAVGAMLYQLLAGRMPYHRPGQRLNPHTVLALVLQGPPPGLLEIEPRAPAELVAICEKAMAREPDDRYADMLALSGDMQAYLEDRVVRAYATGPLVELHKWVVRNRAWAAAGFLALLLVVSGGIASFLQAKRLQAEQEARDYRLFLKYAQLEESALRVDSSEMWPATPDRIPVYDAWLEAVDEWLRGAEEVRLKLEARRASGTMMRFPSPDSLQIRELAERAGLRVEEGMPRAVREALEVWNFNDPENRWLHDQTARLVRTIERFVDPIEGLVDGRSPQHGWGIARRRAWALRVHELTVSGSDASARWTEAIGSIAASRLYDGLVIEPQLGLLPLGPDPESDLWEFALLQTGDAPERAEYGDLVLEEATALVLVLIPGGTFTMGAQRFDSFGPNFDPKAEPDEGPLHDVTLAPFFLSKYEMNQAQWKRIAGQDPSVHQGEPWFPVENIRWGDCTRLLGWLGCSLPTEAQWEYAARAGTSTPWWTGDTVASLQDCSNIADASVGKTALDRPYEKDIDDGSPYISLADAFLPNPFGLLGIHGNVWEWCLDEYTPYQEGPQTDPLAPPLGRELIGRGGSYGNRANFSRCANRSRFTPDFLGNRLGVRPAKRIEGEIRRMR